MSNRCGTAAHRAVAGAAAVTLAVLLSGCGGDGEGGNDKAGREPEKAGSASAAPSGQPAPDGDDGPTVPDTSKTLATINSSDGFQFVVHSAVRDSGGFLTVSGTLKNTTSQLLVGKAQWSGTEVNVTRTGPSFAGATLVDKTEKKRYYVLRDTEGYPLTTTGVTSVKAGGSVAVFAQFPAPPASVSQVDLQIPLMPVATIEIS
ncbi:hypothetical protein ABZ498_12215 [Streptomyces lavendulocolor]|uniref:hypothetical protein n=1 Tax=Streptomyces lavendulocolor TaxID=67316 RepID=UPI0033D411E6